MFCLDRGAHRISKGQPNGSQTGTSKEHNRQTAMQRRFLAFDDWWIESSLCSIGPHTRPWCGGLLWATETTTAGTDLPSPIGLGNTPAVLTRTGTGFMSYAYEGPATIGVLALYRRQTQNKLTSYKLNARILYVERQRFRLELDR
jgi:hypothetical protein